jgi:hypothetical protein
MSNNEANEEKAIVSYERFAEDDTTSADYRRKLDQYVWANLPLTDAQKREFGQLLQQEAKAEPESKSDSD